MNTLYYAPGAASLLVHWLLVELDVAHELRPVDIAARQHKQADYLALNPSGVVPTLVVDGVAMTEAAAIALWLVDTHPAAGLAPPPGDPARPALMQWMFHLANAVQPLLRTWWYPREAAGEAHADAARVAVESRLGEAWTRIDSHLAGNGPYMLGDWPTVVDFYLVMLMRWSRKSGRPADTWPALATLAAAMTARPSFATICAREGLEEWTLAPPGIAPRV